jgi:hypothetical protein
MYERSIAEDRVEAVVLLPSAQSAIRLVICSEFADRDYEALSSRECVISRLVTGRTEDASTVATAGRLAVECHELDLESLAVGIDMNNRPNIADLQAFVHRRGQHHPIVFSNRSSRRSFSVHFVVLHTRLLPRGSLIPAPVENTRDQQFRVGLVVDHVILNHERAHGRTEFRTPSSHARIFCEEFESVAPIASSNRSARSTLASAAT